MAQLIQIKRSLNTADPGSLANGELAYTANGDVLFIGSNGSYYAIAGRRYPGTLTANQAVTVNSSSLIDTIKIGNTSQNVVISTSGIQINNTASGGNTITIPAPTTSEKGDGNRYLKADGTWSTVTGATANPAGQNTYIQYNDSGSMGGAADLTFAEDTKVLTVNGAMYIGTGTSNLQSNQTHIKIQSNSTTWALLSEGTLRLSNTVSNTQITIPTTGERSGSYFLKADGTWALVSASVGGADTQVLFNDGGSVSNGTAGFTFAKASNNVFIANTVNVGTFTANSTLVNTAAINVTNQTNTATFYATTSANVGANMQITTAAITLGSGSGTTAESISISNTVANTVRTAAQVKFQYGATSNALVNSTGYFVTGNATTLPMVNVSTSGIFLGNGTVTATGTTIDIGNSAGNNVLTTTNSKIQINSTANVTLAPATGLVLNSNGTSNATVNSLGAFYFGNSTTLAAVNVGSAGFFLGNSTSTTTTAIVDVANSQGNSVINAGQVKFQTSASANALVNSSGYFVTGNATTLPMVNVSTAGIYYGNGSGTATGATLNMANSTGNVVLTTTTAKIQINSTANVTLAPASGLQLNSNGTSNATVNSLGAFFFGNSTTLAAVNVGSAGFFFGNSTSTTTTAIVDIANSQGNSVINAGQVKFQTSSTANSTVNSSGYFVTGNATTLPMVNVSTAGFWMGNGSGTATGTLINIANSAGNTVINTTDAKIQINSTANVSFAPVAGLTLNSNSSQNSVLNTTAFTITGNTTTAASFIANQTGVYVGNSSVTATGLTFTLANSLGGSTGSNVQITAPQIKVQNSSATCTITPVSATIGTTVVNTTAIQVAGGPTINATTLSITDIVVSGNLDINGTLTTIDTTNMAVTDSIIQLARGNAGATIDIGLIGNYNDGSGRYTGLYWDQSNTVWELFANTTVDLSGSTTIDPTGANSVRAKLNAYLRSGWGSGLFEANSTGVTITANSTYAVALTANSLSLTTALPAGSGGTGFGTYAAGDLLYANTTPALDKLARGSDGYVLQANSTSILWGSIDGGTF